MSEQCKEHGRLIGMVEKVHDCLLGTFDKKGLVSVVTDNSRRIDENKAYIDSQKKTRNGWLDWTFRCAIGIILSFIAVKVGVK